MEAAGQEQQTGSPDPDLVEVVETLCDALPDRTLVDEGTVEAARVDHVAHARVATHGAMVLADLDVRQCEVGVRAPSDAGLGPRDAMRDLLIRAVDDGQDERVRGPERYGPDDPFRGPGTRVHGLPVAVHRPGKRRTRAVRMQARDAITILSS